MVGHPAAGELLLVYYYNVGVACEIPLRGDVVISICFPKTLMGPKGPCLLGRMNLKTGTHWPVQSQAVNWATAGLLVGPLACWWTWRMCVSLSRYG
jgi:hypothetical protein